VIPRTHETQAGPGLSRGVQPPDSQEAAGPATPRLLIHEVGVRLGPQTLEARAVLSAGPHRFTGAATAGAGASRQDAWQLAAAAAVAAIQQYLHHCTTDPPTPQLHLTHIALTTSASGQELIHAAVRLAQGSFEADLLGSAPLRNDPCTAAVAAALDAVSRRLGLFPLRASGPSPAPPAQAHQSAEPAPPPLPPEQPPELEVASPSAPAPRESASEPALAIHVSATAIRAAAIGAAGQVLAEARRPARPTAEPRVNLSLAIEAAREALAGLNHSAANVRAVGVALPGRLQPDQGLCLASGDFPSWHDVQVAGPISEALERPVTLIGAAQAAALAESRYGAGEGLDDLLLVRVGIDIDLAVIAAGRPLLEERQTPGQAGHMVIDADGPRCSCGDLGCWQALANRDSLVARVLRALRAGQPSALLAAVDNHLGAITPALICRFAAAGDDLSRRALQETGRYLALGLANLIALFDPQAVILDSSPPAVGAALLQAAESTLKSSPRARLFSRCVLLSPSLGDTAPLIGAALHATARLST